MSRKHDQRISIGAGILIGAGLVLIFAIPRAAEWVRALEARAEARTAVPADLAVLI